jgi:hypothetical protein
MNLWVGAAELMRTVACEQCGQSVPQNGTFRAFGRVLCEPCADADVQARKEIAPGSVSREHDPTVCGFCAYDGGTLELATIGGVPVCTPCESNLRNRPFPLWVKAALAAVIVLTIVAMTRNYRFFHGYYAAKQADRAAQKADFESAAHWLDSAATSVPEAHAYRTGSKLYEGIVFMQQDRNAEALARFQEISGAMQEQGGIDDLLLQAELAVAFDAKDYAGMVKAAENLAERHSESRMSRLQRASAYACQYASAGDEEARKKVVEAVESEQSQSDLTDDDKKYLNRIQHRLATREILSGKEFEQRFPKGWKAEEETP